ncbi:MAG: MoaD/ThiS family protein [Chloroflexi bacterium]|nr:MoaD/ThiS family protein [Chloroflexota bacterium]
MATIFIPTMLQKLTDGTKTLEMDANNVRQVVDELEKLYPGIEDRLMEADDIREGMAVVVDGDVAIMGMLTKVGETSEVHFVPAIAGGR